MAEQAGVIKYDAVIDSKQLDKQASQIEKNLTQSAQRGSSGFTKAMGIATTAGAVAFGALAGMAVKSFANYEQLTGGVETLFKESSSQVMEYAENAYKTSGLSANQYMETVTSFSASLLQGLGGDTAKAAKYSEMAVTDMADNANKMGTSIGLIQNAYQGFAKDNYTMLDNLKLGYGGTATEMARLINDTGVMGKEFKATAENVSDIPFDKVVLAINSVQKEMGITGTTAKEATETISGSWNSLTAAFSNVLTGVEGSGQQFADTVLNMIEQLVEKVPPIVANMASGLIDALKTVIDEKFGEGAFDIISTIAVLFGTLAVAVTAYQTAVTIATTVQSLFNAVMAANPIVVVAIAVIALTAALVYFFTQTETGKKIVEAFNDWINNSFIPTIQAIGQWFADVWTGIKNIWGGVVNWFKSVWTGIKNIFSAIGGWFSTKFSEAVQGVRNAWSGITGFFSGIWGKIKGIFSDIGNAIASGITGAVTNAVNGVLRVAGNIINNFIDAINVAIDIINKIPKVNVGKLGRLNIPQMASGGIVKPTNGGILANIAEGGEAEAVIPLSKLESMLGGNGSNNAPAITLNLNMSGVMTSSPEEERTIARRLIHRMNEELRAKGMQEIGV